MFWVVACLFMSINELTKESERKGCPQSTDGAGQAQCSEALKRITSRGNPSPGCPVFTFSSLYSQALTTHMHRNTSPSNPRRKLCPWVVVPQHMYTKKSTSLSVSQIKAHCKAKRTISSYKSNINHLFSYIMLKVQVNWLWPLRWEGSVKCSATKCSSVVWHLIK